MPVGVSMGVGDKHVASDLWIYIEWHTCTSIFTWCS